ncbi:MAG: glycosyltransferase [Betaproteobacteria bacterium]|nr:MAG: glycosyltransferase [Betaproteobacteria bacterium]
MSDPKMQLTSSETLLVIFDDDLMSSGDAISAVSSITASCSNPVATVRADYGDSRWTLRRGDRAVTTDSSLTELLLAAARLCGADSILFSTQATRTPGAWDARLLKALAERSDIGLVSSLCVDHPLLGASFEATNNSLDTAQTSDIDTVDAAAFCVSGRTYYSSPVAHRFGSAAPVSALESLALFESINDDHAPCSTADAWIESLVRANRSRGALNVVVDHVVVDPRQVIAAVLGDHVEVSAFRDANPLGATQRAVSQYLRDGVATLPRPGLDPRPVQLHVMHFWGGGLDKWVREFCAHDNDRINLLFTSYRIGESGGQRLALYADGSGARPIRVWDIVQPIRSTLITSLEYQAVLAEIIRDYSVDAILVSSLIGHSLDALTSELPTVLIAHDYFPVCQAINPSFRGAVCKTCDTAALTDCQTNNPLNRFFTDQGAAEWKSLRTAFLDRLLERAIPVVAPSRSVIDTLIDIEPRMASLTIRVVPHGQAAVLKPLLTPALAAGERMRFIVLGQVRENKGAALLRSAAKAIDEIADVHFLGCGEEGAELARSLGWAFIERFEPSELREHMLRIDPHAALLASVVPETFSYTLSELFALAVPPVATNIGAFAERIEHGRNGFLFAANSDSLVESLRELTGTPQSLLIVAEHLRANRLSRSVTEMVGDYHQILTVRLRAPARYRLGTARQTALTEPYEKLTAAYAQMSNAYERTAAAYESTAAAYQSVAAQELTVRTLAQSQAEALHSISQRYAIERSRLNEQTAAARAALAAIDLRRHPWRLWAYVKALRAQNAAVDAAVRALPAVLSDQTRQ